MWEIMKELYAGCFLIVAATWILGHLVAIKICGIIRIYEPNSIILWIEIVLLILIIALGVERLIKDLRKGK